ncbi:MAG: CRISPR-associated protein Csx16 [Methylobacteriaceae bacterium]|jgi:CRISPR-associated protein Csx16|nr:CRISPR-associated protein Csx16 [Methylobacteriaceae bacterium]
MTRWFVSRHPGAVDWAKHRTLRVDRFVSHLDPAEVAAGDVVMGTLPVDIAAEVCRRGASFYHLRLNASEDQRGRDLSADDLRNLGAGLEKYLVTRLEDDDEL